MISISIIATCGFESVWKDVLIEPTKAHALDYQVELLRASPSPCHLAPRMTSLEAFFSQRSTRHKPPELHRMQPEAHFLRLVSAL